MILTDPILLAALNRHSLWHGRAEGITPEQDLEHEWDHGDGLPVDPPAVFEGLYVTANPSYATNIADARALFYGSDPLVHQITLLPGVEVALDEDLLGATDTWDAFRNGDPRWFEAVTIHGMIDDLLPANMARRLLAESPFAVDDDDDDDDFLEDAGEWDELPFGDWALELVEPVLRAWLAERPDSPPPNLVILNRRFRADPPLPRFNPQQRRLDWGDPTVGGPTRLTSAWLPGPDPLAFRLDPGDWGEEFRLFFNKLPAAVRLATAAHTATEAVAVVSAWEDVQQSPESGLFFRVQRATFLIEQAASDPAFRETVSDYFAGRPVPRNPRVEALLQEALEGIRGEFEPYRAALRRMDPAAARHLGPTAPVSVRLRSLVLGVGQIAFALYLPVRGIAYAQPSNPLELGVIRMLDVLMGEHLRAIGRIDSSLSPAEASTAWAATTRRWQGMIEARFPFYMTGEVSGRRPVGSPPSYDALRRHLASPRRRVFAPTRRDCRDMEPDLHPAASFPGIDFEMEVQALLDELPHVARVLCALIAVQMIYPAWLQDPLVTELLHSEQQAMPDIVLAFVEQWVQAPPEARPIYWDVVPELALDETNYEVHRLTAIRTKLRWAHPESDQQPGFLISEALIALLDALDDDHDEAKAESSRFAVGYAAWAAAVDPTDSATRGAFEPDRIRHFLREWWSRCRCRLPVAAIRWTQPGPHPWPM